VTDPEIQHHLDATLRGRPNPAAIPAKPCPPRPPVSKTDQANPVPDICERVHFEDEHWRVDCWIRYQGEQTFFCHREEATHIGIYSNYDAALGYIVEIGEVTRMGTYINWPQRIINKERAFAECIAGGSIL